MDDFDQHLKRAGSPIPFEAIPDRALEGVTSDYLETGGADILARWLLAPQELPVGVLTAALGGTYLLWLMHRRTSSQGSLL